MGALIEVDIFTNDPPWFVTHMIIDLQQRCGSIAFKWDDNLVDNTRMESYFFLVGYDPTGALGDILRNIPGAY